MGSDISDSAKHFSGKTLGTIAIDDGSVYGESVWTCDKLKAAINFGHAVAEKLLTYIYAVLIFARSVRMLEFIALVVVVVMVVSGIEEILRRRNVEYPRWKR